MKPTRPTPRCRPRQEGIALLLFLFLLVIAGTALFLTAANRRPPELEREAATAAALRQAKEALLGDAASYRTSSNVPLPGHLRCPELLSPGSPTEGQAASSCTGTGSRLGRLPWRTLKLDRLVDGYGEPLWYAVSPGFSSAPINSATPGQLTVNNQANAAVAVIIAPGPPLPGQNRGQPDTGNPPAPANYLELGNANGQNFQNGAPTGTFNDRIVTITREELFAVVNKIVLATVKGQDDQSTPDPDHPDLSIPLTGLWRYYRDNKQFPWATATVGGSAVPNLGSGSIPSADILFTGNTWLSQNKWFALIGYQRLTPDQARIDIGNTFMIVRPCSRLPCP